jgi:fatty-acyl-CoA synthase
VAFEVRTRGRGGGRQAWALATTVGDLHDRAGIEHPDSELVFPDERCTYAELTSRANAIARSLCTAGIRAGEHVGVLLLPGIDYLAALCAIAKIGAVSVPINARFKTRELLYVVDNADLAAILVSPALTAEVDYAGMLASVLPSLAEAGQSPGMLRLPEAPRLRSVILMGPGERAGCTTRAEFDAAADQTQLTEVECRQERVRIRDTAIIMYTSGTESNPKGCLLTHEAVVRNAICIADTRFELTPEDRMWNPLPLFHTGGLVLFYVCLAAGASYVHNGHFNPDVAVDQLERERITFAHPAFETIWLAVIGHPRFEQADLSRIRGILNVGVPERLRSMQRALPNARLFSCFGATEASSHLALCRPDDDPDKAFTTGGHPLPGMEVRIVDPETGAELPPDTEGEVLYRGPHRFDGYYKAPELTAECIDKEGWFHSKDVGVLDADGRLTFKSRLKDMLKVGGENVGAAEIESLIAEHPAVALVQVVAAPDARYVQVPAAFIQLKDDHEATADEIIAFCTGRIATFKVPRHVRFVTEWPMSGTKIRKTELREQIATELGAVTL